MMYIHYSIDSRYM